MKRHIQGLAVFLAAGLVLGYVSFPLQRAFGVYGLAVTELITLGIAVAAMVVWICMGMSVRDYSGGILI